jgi:hypothetical protein
MLTGTPPSATQMADTLAVARHSACSPLTRLHGASSSPYCRRSKRVSRATSPGVATAESAGRDTADALERLGEGELVVVTDSVGHGGDALALLE